ncbi:hypothetical protein D9M68_845870 [compost metagenome]
MNGSQLMHYEQPSFKGTHGRFSSCQDNGTGGVTTSDIRRRPIPNCYNRYNK